MVDLAQYGLNITDVRRNLPPARLYEEAIAAGDSHIMSSGALATTSGEKTGRSPKDKRIVRHPDSENDIWWGDINFELSQESFARSKQHARRTDGF